MLRLILFCLCMSLVQMPAIAWAEEGAVTGRLVLDSGKPFDDGFVFFFNAESSLARPETGKFWRVPDYVDRTGAEGTFLTAIPAGTYYVGATKRMTAVTAGPPVDGDYFLPSRDRKGRYRSVTVKDGETVDLGTITGIQRYSSNRSVYRGKVTAIEGKLVRADGSPAEGMLVFAYRSAAQQERPLLVSTRSDRAGRYRLLLDKGRIVYLKARESYAGGAPSPGTLIGFYGGGQSMQPVAARTDKVIKEIDIVVTPFAMRGF